TAIADPPKYSLVQITNPDVNETQVYAIGDKYQGARIYGVQKDRVLLDHDGVNEYIDNNAAAPPNLGVVPMPQPGGPPQASNDVRQLSENQYVIAKSTINEALTDMSKLATQARIVPSFKNGASNGFKLFSIVPDSLYAKIGIQNGDVIRKINGYEMNSPDKALEIYQKLRDANRIEVEVERRGETVRKSYSIE
ncbi:MAG: type II secretion system protein GspC, partial [Deltaproteobacteria bacterium]